MDYFINELDRIQQLAEVPLMAKRMDKHKDDAMEELMEVYQDVKEIEGHLAKTINIASFIIQKHQQLFQDCIDMQDELEAIELGKQTVEEQRVLDTEEIKTLRQW